MWGTCLYRFIWVLTLMLLDYGLAVFYLDHFLSFLYWVAISFSLHVLGNSDNKLTPVLVECMTR